MSRELFTVMRWLLALPLLLLSACGKDDCPEQHGLSCSGGQQGLTCDYKEEGGDTASCTCNGAFWNCNTCPDGQSPVGACAAGQACEVWGFENACACSCDANGQWSCVVDDPSPNFHCSP